MALTFGGWKEEKNVSKTEEKDTLDLTIEIAEYKILKVEEQSRKAIGKKILSKYQATEIENWPINKRMLYRIVFSKNDTENLVKRTVEKIIVKLEYYP